MKPKPVARKSLPQGKYLLLAFCILLALLLPLLIKSQYNQSVIILILLFAMMSSAWNIVCGFLGELSLGHCVFVGIGGYTSTMLLMQAGVSPWIGMLLGCVVAGCVGLIIGYPCFKLRGPYFTLTTIAFAELMRVYIENTEKGPFGIPFNGAMGLLLPRGEGTWSIMQFDSKAPYYYIILSFLAVTLLAAHFIKSHRLGYYLVAIRSNPDAASSLGINITKYKNIAMFISCALIALGGSFYAQYFRYINPERIFGMDISLQIALTALIGGQGTIFGPVVGALILVPISELLAESFGGSVPGLNLFIYGAVLVVVVFYMPHGIYQPLSRFFNWIEKQFRTKFLGDARRSDNAPNRQEDTQ